MSKDRHGFSALEALLVIVIVAIVGFVGWYLYHVKHDVDTVTQATSQSNEPAQTPAQRAVNTARSTFQTASAAALKSQKSSPGDSSTKAALAGLKAVQPRLTTQLYDKITSAYAAPQPEGHMNDVLICAFGQMGYFDVPVRTTLQASDKDTATVKLVAATINYVNGKQTYTYDNTGALYTVNLSSQQVTDITCPGH